VSTSATRAQLAIGTVRHLRLRPAVHRFDYPTYFLLLPLRALRAQPDAALVRNGFGLVSFHDRDHGDGRADCLAWLDEQLAREGVDDADGEVWLQTYPRVLGYAFKPVSFWYCHRHDGTLAAIVAEVNNTFGERHCYLLRGAELDWAASCTRARCSTSRRSVGSRASTAFGSRAAETGSLPASSTTMATARCC